MRYHTTDDGAVDGLSGREGAFLACSFWLADCLHMIGRTDDAKAMFERLLTVRNGVGLLSEEYDPVAGRLVGNFPQAFSHVSLVNTAFRLCGQVGPGTPLPPARARRGRRRVRPGGHPGARVGEWMRRDRPLRRRSET
jgi:hypothetical protein